MKPRSAVTGRGDIGAGGAAATTLPEPSDNAVDPEWVVRLPDGADEHGRPEYRHKKAKDCSWAELRAVRDPAEADMSGGFDSHPARIVICEDIETGAPSLTVEPGALKTDPGDGLDERFYLNGDPDVLESFAEDLLGVAATIRGMCR